MTNSFDDMIRDALQQSAEVPPQVHARIEETLQALPQQPPASRTVTFPVKAVRRTASVAACVLFAALFLLPNISFSYARAAAELPVIGKLVQVLTVRRDFYEDRHQELDVSIPAISDPDHDAASTLINQDVEALTQAVVARFRQDQSENGSGYGSLHIDYDVVTSTDSWFTLRLWIEEVAGSSGAQVYYYHIDRTSGQYITLGDLVTPAAFPAFEALVRQQMVQQMANDPNVSYWDDDPQAAALSAQHNFYLTETGDLVLVYDQFTVAPGYMGCPSFTIPAQECARYAAPQYAAFFTAK